MATMTWDYAQIAAAAQHLAPMRTPTRLNLEVQYNQDIGEIADKLAEIFPDAIHVGFGDGRVSRGRLSNALPDEIIDPSAPQVIIAEVYTGGGDSYQQFTRAAFETCADFRSHLIDLMSVPPQYEIHPNTVVIFVAYSMPTPFINRSINFAVTH